MNAPTREDCARSMAVEILQASGKLQLRVTGSSMLPTLWPGDLLTLQSTASDPICPGEIVLFQREDRLVIHRVVRLSSHRQQDGVMTRGDSMAQDDAPIAVSDVLGRVTEVRRGPRTISVVTPSTPARALGWMLCHSSLLSRIALRWHAARQKRSGLTVKIPGVA